jgi:hypothetical protein
LEKIVQQIQVGIITADDKGRIITQNTGARRILNVDNTRSLEHLANLPIPLPKKIPSSDIVSMLDNDLDKRYFYSARPIP